MEKIWEKLAEYLYRNGFLTEEDKGFFVYGISSAVFLIINILTSICLGLYFNRIMTVIVFLLFYAPLRSYAGGYHCKRRISCFVVSNMFILVVLFITLYISVSCYFLVGLLLVIMGSLIVFKFAPLGSDNKPLDKEEIKYYGKKARVILGIEILTILFLFRFNWTYFGFVASLGIFMVATLLFLEWNLSRYNWKERRK